MVTVILCIRSDGCVTGRKSEERGLCPRYLKLIGHLGEWAFGKVILAKRKMTHGHSASKTFFDL